jgi:hypothetical protein
MPLDSLPVSGHSYGQDLHILQLVNNPKMGLCSSSHIPASRLNIYYVVWLDSSVANYTSQYPTNRPTDWPTDQPSWSRVLENHVATRLVKKFPAFCGIWRYIIMFIVAHHWSLSWARWIQFAPSHPISLRSALILSSHLWVDLPSGFFPLGFVTKILYFPSLPCVLHDPLISSSLIQSP